MNKVIPLVFTFSVTAASVLTFGESGFSLSNMNNSSHDETVEQVDSSDSSDSLF